MYISPEVSGLFFSTIDNKVLNRKVEVGDCTIEMFSTISVAEYLIY
jgi:hypothetical protein